MYYLYRVSQHNMCNFDWLLQVQKGKYAELFKKKYPGKNDSIYEVKFNNYYTVRKSFREFQKSVFIHELLHKIFCKEGLNISEILWAFRICATSKCQTNNKVERSV